MQTPSLQTKDIPWQPSLQAQDIFIPGRLSLRVLRRDPQPNFAAHRHQDFHELVVVLGGHGLHQSGASATPIGAGDVFVITGEREHGYFQTRHLQLVNIAFERSQIDILSADLNELPGYRALFNIEPKFHGRTEFKQFMRLDSPQLQSILPLIDDLESEIELGMAGHMVAARGIFAQMITLLSRYYEAWQDIQGVADRLVAMAKVVNYIEKQYPTAVSMDKLAELAHMSGRSLRRHFKDAMGHSPIEYLLETRLKAAESLLTQNLLGITELALQCGFSDGNYFSRQFKLARGLSPKDYRKLSLNQK